MNDYAIFWLIFSIILIVVEAATPALVCIWLSLGGLITFAFSLLGAPLWLQIIIFVISSVALVFATRPLAQKYVYKKSIATNADRIIGAEGVVIQEIDPIENIGQIKAMGQVWSAKEQNGGSVQTGAYVTVVALEGVKAVVREK